MKFNEYFKAISNESFMAFSETSHIALEKITKDKELIISMLNNVLTDETLIMKSECYDFLDKIVCYTNEESDIHVRISLFNEKYANRIHYHRWDYTASVLVGCYEQYFYGVHNGNDITELYPYEPIYIGRYLPNEVYSLDHTMVHSVIARPDTISICIRGRAYGERFQTIDKNTNTSWWQYGSKTEAKEERIMKSVSFSYLKERIEYIKKILYV